MHVIVILSLFFVRSFVEMTRYLLSQPNSDGLFLLSERISQDPIENYFGKQRAHEVAGVTISLSTNA